MKAAISPSVVRQDLAYRGISLNAIAARLGVHRAHLHRVLRGERPGSQALLQSVVEIADSMPGQGKRYQKDVSRLIGAAVHSFWVKRGNFQSAVFEEPVAYFVDEKEGSQE